jgi:hypothetical protein
MLLPNNACTRPHRLTAVVVDRFWDPEFEEWCQPSQSVPFAELVAAAETRIKVTS